jgi:hypothetical protein
VTQERAERERVEVWQQPDGSWRWRYVTQDGEERVELPSNEPDSSRDEAVHKASVAYPDVPVEVREPPRGDPEEGHGPSGARPHAPGFLVPALVAAGSLVVAIRRPRWWTAVPALAAVALTVHRVRAR